MKKVTMNLTDKDVDNTNYIRMVFSTRSNAEAISIALKLTRFLCNSIDTGDQLLIKKLDDSFEKVIIPGLTVFERK